MSISFASANVLLLKASVTPSEQSLAGAPGGPAIAAASVCPDCRTARRTVVEMPYVNY